MTHLSIFLAIFLWSTWGLAASSVESPAHHMFNTTMLKPKTYQISIIGNGKYGLTENLEIGTQALVFRTTPNFYLRHRMFDLGDTQTTFSSHFFRGGLTGNSGMTGISLITTSIKPGGRSIYSFGILDFFSASTEGDLLRDDLSTTHIVAPTFSWDYYFSDNFMGTFISILPFYGSLDLRDDFTEVEAEFFFLFSDQPVATLGMGTFTYSTDGSFNFEFGAAFGSAGSQVQFIPYLNLFWRTN